MNLCILVHAIELSEIYKYLKIYWFYQYLITQLFISLLVHGLIGLLLLLICLPGLLKICCVDQADLDLKEISQAVSQTLVLQASITKARSELSYEDMEMEIWLHILYVNTFVNMISTYRRIHISAIYIYLLQFI